MSLTEVKTRPGGGVRTFCVMVLLLMWTVLTCFPYGVARIAKPLSPRAVHNLRTWLMGYWGRGCVRLFGGRMEIHGTPPQAPFFLVSNHLSYIDIVAIAGAVSPVFVAKSEIRKWPVLGFIFHICETIFIDRESLRDVVRTKQLVDEALQEGFGVHIFAEGGIPLEGRLIPFKPALFDVAAKSGYPVHVASFSYTTPEDGPTPYELIPWLSGVSFLQHVRKLLASKGFTVHLHFAEEPLTLGDRKELAEQAYETVRRLHTPLA